MAGAFDFRAEDQQRAERRRDERIQKPSRHQEPLRLPGVVLLACWMAILTMLGGWVALGLREAVFWMTHR